MWTTENIPDLTGKTAIVTGSNTGIGFEIAAALYRSGAHVIVAGRDTNKVEEAIGKIRSKGGKGILEAGLLNLANLGEVKRFANDFNSKHQQLHLLINNAGIMIPPAGHTDDGYELQFGVNFLGHFALTGHLYSLLRQTQGARVVNLSSGAHKRINHIDFDNLKLEKDYDAAREYSISKLSNVIFTLELQRRIERVSDHLISVGAHPGVTYTDLQRHMDKDIKETAFKQFKEVMEPWQGALPALYAATASDVKGADYYGPDGENEISGYPAPAFINDAAKDIELAQRLWDYAENAAHVVYP